MQRISPWALTEYDEEGEAIVHGYCDGSDTEVLFELQNLTEVGAAGFRAKALHVGLCGLAYRARVCAREMTSRWLPLEKPVMRRPSIKPWKAFVTLPPRTQYSPCLSTTRRRIS